MTSTNLSYPALQLRTQYLFSTHNAVFQGHTVLVTPIKPWFRRKQNKYIFFVQLGIKFSLVLQHMEQALQGSFEVNV